MDQSIGHGFAEGVHIHLGHRHAEHADAHFLFRVVGPKIRFQPVQGLKQGNIAKFIQLHGFLRHDLKSQFMRGHQLAQGGFAANQKQAGQGRYVGAIRLPVGQPQHAVQVGIFQFQQGFVAAINFNALTKAFTFQRVQIRQGRLGNRMCGHIQQAKGAGPAETVMGEHGRAFRSAVMFETSAQVHATTSGCFARTFGDADPGHFHAADFHGFHGHSQ